MTQPNTPGYVPSGPLPTVAWDPDNHLWRELLGQAGQLHTTRYFCGVASNPTTTSTVYVDIPDLIDTSSTGGPNGLTVDLLVILALSVTHQSLGALSYVGIALDGGAERGALPVSASTALDSFPLTACAIFQDVLPGAHTLKGRWKTSAGTLGDTLASRCMSVVELRR